MSHYSKVPGLKPCPLCGGDRFETRDTNSPPAGSQSGEIRCVCGLELSGDYGERLSSVKQKWNRRALSSLPVRSGEVDCAAVIRRAEAAEADWQSASGEVERLREAAQGVLDHKASTYKARNGRDVGIQADDGEKCWIVHSDDIQALEAALATPQQVKEGDRHG